MTRLGDCRFMDMNTSDSVAVLEEGEGMNGKPSFGVSRGLYHASELSRGGFDQLDARPCSLS